MALEKFKAHELTKSQYAQVLGSRSKRVDILNAGGSTCVEITTIDRNNGTVVQRYRYFECNKAIASLDSDDSDMDDMA